MGLVKRTYVDGETVITADNLNDIQDEIIQNASDISEKGTYSKPTGGIPSTDMTTAVQTSLGKADTAYQKPSGGIPSTDLASAVQTSLGKADTAYQKPSGGIPSTDLASAVQTSLGKADTALQSSDIDSTLTVTGKAADAKKTGDEISDVRNTLNQIGTFLTGTNSASLDVPPNTFTTLSTLYIPAGTWVINGGHGFYSSFLNLCTSNLFYVGGATIPGTSVHFTGDGGGGVILTKLMKLDAPATIGMRTYQTSSETRSAGLVSLNAVRIS